MDEARRQHYLQAMGIPMWYARASLPGAKPSPEYDFSGFYLPVAEAEARPRVSPQVSSQKQPQGAADLLKKVAQDLVPQASREASKPVEIPLSVPEEVVAADDSPNAASMLQGASIAAEVPEFCVRAYGIGSYLALNLAHPEIDAHRESGLLANIAAACWGAASEFLYEMAWPVFTNSRLPGQNAEVAQAVLASLLKEYLDNKKGLILFGQPPLWPEQPLGAIGQADQMAGLSMALPMVATWSLGEMLLVPQRKRDVWLHLHRFSGAD